MSRAAEPAVSIDYLKTVDTPTLSNAIELLRVRPQSEGFAPCQVRCLFPELGRMVGYAVTAHVETMTKAPMDRSTFVKLYKAVEESPKPAIVAFQEVGPHPRLLLNILPGAIAERLKQGEERIADGFAEVTVLFADVVGFTAFSSNTPAAKLVSLLNDLFSRFDAASQRHGIEKIKTIGD